MVLDNFWIQDPPLADFGIYIDESKKCMELRVDPNIILRLRAKAKLLKYFGKSIIIFRYVPRVRWLYHDGGSKEKF